MSSKQKEAVTCKILSSNYTKIAAVFAELPERFKLTELLRIAGISDGPAIRSAIGVVLSRDFHCINVANGANRFWKKP